MSANGPIVRVLQNGTSRASADATISALDRGFMLGDGLFETMRLYGGVPFALNAHLARMKNSAAALLLKIPAELPGFIASVLNEGQLAGMFQNDCLLRITVSRGSGTRPGLSFDADQPCTVVAALAHLPPFDNRIVSQGVRACWAAGKRNEHAATSGHKTVAFGDAIVEFARARESGMDDCVFVDTQGHLSEASTSNVFLFDGEALITPALSCGALPGITRAVVLDLASRLSIPVEERVVEKEEVALANEAFLTSSLREIVPLVQVGDWQVGRGNPGEITRLLVERYKDVRSQG